MRYVCGFALCGTQVAMITKTKPPKLAGQLNGIGGKIERSLGDTSATVAMVREFAEEAGVETDTSEWDILGNLFIGKDTVHWFRINLDQERFNTIRTMEDEEIFTCSIWDAITYFPTEAYAKIFLLAAAQPNVELINITLK